MAGPLIHGWSLTARSHTWWWASMTVIAARRPAGRRRRRPPSSRAACRAAPPCAPARLVHEPPAVLADLVARTRVCSAILMAGLPRLASGTPRPGSHSAAGMSTARSRSASVISAALRAPMSTLATAGWVSGKRAAAARSGTPNRAQASCEAPGPLDQLGGCRLVVVGRARVRGGEHAGVEHAAGDDRHAAAQRRGQQLGRGGLVEQRVPAGHQHHVDVRVGDEPGEHLRLVHAGADRADDAGRAQLLQRRVGLAERLLGVVVRVVDERDVDPVEAEPGQARLQAARDAVGAEVEPPDVAGGDGEPLGVAAWRAVARAAAAAVPGGRAGGWAEAGSSSRPTLVQITYSSRGRCRSASPRRRSDSPRP